MIWLPVETGNFILEGNTGNAIAGYDKVIKLNPENAMAYSIRGLAYNAQGQLDSGENGSLLALSNAYGGNTAGVRGRLF